MWSSPNNPQIFGALEIPAQPLRAFIDEARAAGHRVTPTHLIGRAIGYALAAVPEMNVQIRRGHLIPRDAVEVFFITAVAGGTDLSGVKITAADETPAIEIAAELAERSAQLKRGNDPDFARAKKVMDRLPLSILRIALRAQAFVAEDLCRDIHALGVRRNPFGSAMVSSIGMLGLPQGFAPLAWMYDVPLLVLVGELTLKPVVVDGRVEAREVLPVTATIDHRYADGSHISRLMAAFREYLAAPTRFEPSLGRPEAAALPA